MMRDLELLPDPPNPKENDSREVARELAERLDALQTQQNFPTVVSSARAKVAALTLSMIADGTLKTGQRSIAEDIYGMLEDFTLANDTTLELGLILRDATHMGLVHDGLDLFRSRSTGASKQVAHNR